MYNSGMFTPQDLRKRLVAQYISYDKLPNRERFILAMAELCDDIGVHEVGGNNRGPMVEAIQQNEGFDDPVAWCALTVEFCCDAANIDLGPRGATSARVSAWYDWAKANGRLRTRPKRGYLCGLLHSDRTGHIGGVVGSEYNKVLSIEGNTSSGDKGSQRDGGGMYRRGRPVGFWHFYIDLA